MTKESLFLSESLSPDAALERGRALPYALLRTFSAVSLGPTPETLPALEELLEARFFSRDEEIRVFRDGGTLRAVALREASGTVTLESAYEIDNASFGRSLTVRETLGFDDDGQAYVVMSRLSGWKGV